MTKTFTHRLFALVATVGLALTGCGGEAKKSDKPAPDAHAHAEHGPHEGELIELGEEEYHAELKHDDATHTITIYLLDAKAKEKVASDATELTINLVVADKPEQFVLPAVPQEGDEAGKSSRYELVSEPLGTALDGEGVTGRFTVKIGDKSYTGKLAAHDHEHAH
jgi:hypothetical protein